MVSAECYGGVTTKVDLILPSEKEIKMKNTFGSDTLIVSRGKENFILQDKNGFFTLKGEKGKYQLSAM